MDLLLFVIVVYINLVAIEYAFDRSKAYSVVGIIYVISIVDVIYMYYIYNIIPYTVYYYLWSYMLFAMVISPLFELFMLRFSAFDNIRKYWVTEYIESEPVVLQNDNFTMFDTIISAPVRIPFCIITGAIKYISEIFTNSAIKQVERRSKADTK